MNRRAGVLRGHTGPRSHRLRGSEYLAIAVKHTALVALVAALAWSVSADWRDDYRRGREAFESGQWSVVVEAMRAAIAERSEGRSGAGFLGRRYTPRFYLGVALAELGDCQQAVRVFEQAESQGQIQETVDSRAVVLRREACQKLVDDAVQTALVGARRAVQEADQAHQALADLPRDLGAQWQVGEPSLAAMQERAEGLLRQARQRLDEAEKQATGTGLDVVGQLASQAVAEFRKVATAARNRTVELAQREVADARSTLTDSVATAQRRLRAVRDLAPYPTQLGQRVDALKTASDQATSRGKDATPAEADALRQAITDAQDALARAARRPTSRLLNAAERFLVGDWLGTIEALDGARAREWRTLSQICILRTAAAWSLVELTPLKARGRDEPVAGDPADAHAAPIDGAQVEDTQADGTQTDDTQAEGELEPPPPIPAELLADAIEGCRALDPIPVPEEPFFSPRFLVFFQQTLAAPVGEEAAGEEASAGAGA